MNIFKRAIRRIKSKNRGIRMGSERRGENARKAMKKHMDRDYSKWKKRSRNKMKW